MSKKPKQTKKSPIKKSSQPLGRQTLPVPSFPPGSTISHPSLVVDTDGVAWWVDPEARSISQAKP